MHKCHECACGYMCMHVCMYMHVNVHACAYMCIVGVSSWF